jgi:hypothetical protein
MQLDDLVRHVQAVEAKVDALVRLDTQRLRRARVRRTRSALHRLALAVFVGLVVNLVAVALLGLFISDHLGEPRFLLPALVLDAVAIAHVAFGGHQLATLRRLDLGAPVVEIQRVLELLRAARIRATAWTLLAAPSLWIPLLVVGCKGVWDVDVFATFDPAWIVANVAFGLAIVPLARWIARRYGERLRQTSVVRRLADDIAGRSLVAAEGFLAELGRLERGA